MRFIGGFPALHALVRMVDSLRVDARRVEPTSYLDTLKTSVTGADRQDAGHIQSSETEIGRQADVERTRATMASRARR